MIDFIARRLRCSTQTLELAMVVGSKALPGARDRRPYFRRFATRTLNRMLRTATGWRGTDTHGLKRCVAS